MSLTISVYFSTKKGYQKRPYVSICAVVSNSVKFIHLRFCLQTKLDFGMHYQPKKKRVQSDMILGTFFMSAVTYTQIWIHQYMEMTSPLAPRAAHPLQQPAPQTPLAAAAAAAAVPPPAKIPA